MGELHQLPALTFNGSAYTASFTALLGPGDYTAEITGTVNVAQLGIGGTVSTDAIPEALDLGYVDAWVCGPWLRGFPPQREGAIRRRHLTVAKSED